MKLSRRQRKFLYRIIISVVLFLILVITDKIIHIDTLFPNSFILQLALYLSIYFLIGYDVIFDAFRKIIKGQLLDESFLMVIATFGAFSLGIYRAIKGLEIEGFDEGCAVLILFQIGEFFQKYAVNKSRNSISELMDIRPDYANLLNKGEVDPASLVIGDIIICYPGEKIPVDGVIVEGETTLDTKALTGEAMPKEVFKGDEVISGVVNLTSEIKVKVTKLFYDSTVNKILDLVENASSQKSKSENFISKFARIYTPIVVSCALLVFIIGSVITKDIDTWLYRSLNFLVVSCPCSLVISIPLTFFASIGKQSRLNILVKGSNYIEKLAKSNTFVFDKTGTLTKGNFKITKVYPSDKEESILYYASICEANSSHPIALSIKSEYELKYPNHKVLPTYQITNISGMGIKAKKETDVILCGNDLLLESNNVKYDKLSSTGTIVNVCVNNKYLGSIVIEDEIKEEAYELIDSLNKLNLKSIMLTGDNYNVASHVCNSLKMTSFKSDLLPTNKVEALEEIFKNKKENDVICFVGDGINDAPVLTRADIGISMGQVGSDAAIEASDVVIMNDDLSKIITSKVISKKTLQIVKQNIFLSLFIKALIMILSALGYASMYLAIFGDVGVCIICILNALRINKVKIK